MVVRSEAPVDPPHAAHGTAGPAVRRIDPVACIALTWVAFHLWVASPLPIEWGVLRVGETGVRALHLAFAILLAFLLHPLRRDGTARGLRLPNVLVAALAAFCAAYLYLFYARISAHPGDPAAIDVAVATVGLVLLLEATRRLLGWSMVVLALVLLAYILFGAHAPALIAHKSASVGKAMSHLWLSTEGVFGVALGVSAGFIFLFVVFGALLEAAGGGQYLVRGALSLVGHLRGGPAKAAVAVSAATGLVSGSSITNVVTTGPLTIPLVKRIGYPPEKAAAIEVAASINGQVMPPVMGAAAFLMVAYVGIPYLDVLKHALISALVAYLGLLYIVHLEAVKAGLRGLPRLNPYRWRRSLARFVIAATAIAAGAAILFAVAASVRTAFPTDAASVTAGLLLLAYVLLLRLAAPHVLPEEVAAEPIRRMPDPGPALKSGLHFLLPIGLLVWNLIIERLSPADAVFRATIFLIVIVLTQRPLLAWLRGERSELGAAWRRGVRDLLGGFVAGARGMVAIAIATATAGIVVGTLTLTGVGLIMTELIEVLTGGNVLAMLVFVALVCLVLGMGLPTTASYIVVSSLMAPVILTVGAQNGLPVPLIAAHLFVFYFGVLADALPPGGLATYAAASIAGANPLRTGVVAFRYSMRMALLPFMFVLNPELLLIGVHGVGHALLTVLAATLAGFVFISVNQAWLICRTRPSERLLLLLATIMLFHPALFMDPIHPAHRVVSGDAAAAALVKAADGARMRVVVEGTTLEGREVTRVVLLPLGAPAPQAEERLARSGVTASRDEDAFTVLAVTAGGMAAKLGVEPGFRITAVEVAADRPAPQWMFVIALTLIAWVAWRQRRRSGSAAAQAG